MGGQKSVRGVVDSIGGRDFTNPTVSQSVSQLFNFSSHLRASESIEYQCKVVADSIGTSAHVVGSSLSLRSVWEAKSVIGVVDSAMGRLKCDRGRRFYRGPAHMS